MWAFYPFIDYFYFFVSELLLSLLLLCCCSYDTMNLDSILYVLGSEGGSYIQKTCVCSVDI